MDVNTWEASARTILLFAYFLGGSAGSAADSIESVRWVFVKRANDRALFTPVRPEVVQPIRLKKEVVGGDTILDVFVFGDLFATLFTLSTVPLYLDSFRTPDVTMSDLGAISVVIATLGNIGPGFGVVGPMNGFLPFSDAAKLYMILLTWIGRPGVFSVLAILAPSFRER